MILCIKQHLSNICSSIHENIKNTETELKKSVAYWKKACTQILQNRLKFNIVIVQSAEAVVRGKRSCS